MKVRVFACGRCGREVDGTSYGPEGWDLEEDGWVYYNPPAVWPFVESWSPRRGVMVNHPVASYFVCPDCQTDDERPTAERWARIACGRCRREQQGRLDEHGGETEWQEDGWAYTTGASVTLADTDRAQFVLSPWSHICPGCLTGEERAQLDAIEVAEVEEDEAE